MLQQRAWGFWLCLLMPRNGAFSRLAREDDLTEIFSVRICRKQNTQLLGACMRVYVCMYVKVCVCVCSCSFAYARMCVLVASRRASAASAE